MNLRKYATGILALMSLAVLIGCSGEPTGRSNASETDGAQTKGKAESPEFDPNK